MLQGGKNVMIKKLIICIFVLFLLTSIVPLNNESEQISVVGDSIDSYDDELQITEINNDQLKATFDDCESSEIIVNEIISPYCYINPGEHSVIASFLSSSIRINGQHDVDMNEPWIEHENSPDTDGFPHVNFSTSCDNDFMYLAFENEDYQITDGELFIDTNNNQIWDGITIDTFISFNQSTNRLFDSNGDIINHSQVGWDSFVEIKIPKLLWSDCNNWGFRIQSLSNDIWNPSWGNNSQQSTPPENEFLNFTCNHWQSCECGVGFKGLADIWEIQPGECSLIYETDFENEINVSNEWIAKSFDSNPDTWNLSTNRSHSSSHSIHCTEQGTYNDNAFDVLEMKNGLDLSDIKNVTFSFWHWTEGEIVYSTAKDTIADYGTVDFYLPDEGVWIPLHDLSLITKYYDNDWNYTEFTIDETKEYELSGEIITGEELLQDGNKFRFNWTSDTQNHYEGWYIDDVTINTCGHEWYNDDHLIWQSQSLPPEHWCIPWNSTVEETFPLKWNAPEGKYLLNVSLQQEPPWCGQSWIEKMIIVTTNSPSNIYVDDDFNHSTPGWQYDHFNKIQDGIDAVAENGTVYVFNGTYYESLDVIKSISVIGEDKHTTIIDENGHGYYAFDIDADNVTISQFTIKDNDDDAIHCVYRNNVTISDNIFQENDIGIYLHYSENITMKNNTFFSDGIYLSFYGADLNELNTHTIENNTIDGRPIRYYKNDKNIVVPSDSGQVLVFNCTNVTIQNMNISNINTAMQISFCSKVEISDNIIFNTFYGIMTRLTTDFYFSLNEIYDNSYSGLSIESVNNSIITMNNFTNNRYGIYMEYGTFDDVNYISNNRFIDNNNGIWIRLSIGDLYVYHNLFGPDNGKAIGIELYSQNVLVNENIIANNNRGVYSSVGALDNHYYHNTFINNNANALTDWNNTWDNGYPSGGNYWHDYTGSDSNNDGIGDTPKNIPGYYDVDNYPLMHPFGLITELPYGWSFISLPTNISISFSDIIVLHDDNFLTFQEAVDEGIISPFLFMWDRVLQRYDFTNEIIPGYGYWMYTFEDCSLWTFNYERNFDDYISTLESGWNVVGTEFDYPISEDDALVNNYTWTQAVTNGLVSDYIFGWDRISQSYTFSSTFEPGEAYWIYAFEPCVLKRNT